METPVAAQSVVVSPLVAAAASDAVQSVTRLPVKRGDRDASLFDIIERQNIVAHNLARFVPLASDQKRVTGL